MYTSFTVGMLMYVASILGCTIVFKVNSRTFENMELQFRDILIRHSAPAHWCEYINDQYYLRCRELYSQIKLIQMKIQPLLISYQT